MGFVPTGQDFMDLPKIQNGYLLGNLRKSMNPVSSFVPQPLGGLVIQRLKPLGAAFPRIVEAAGVI